MKIMHKIIIIAYIAMTVITYGHAWNQDYSSAGEMKNERQAMTAVMGSVLWPFYWSTVVFERKNQYK